MYTHPSSPANILATWSPIQLNPNCYAPNNTRLNTRHDSDHASQMKMLKTELGFSLSSYLHLLRTQALPSELKFLTTRGTNHSSKTHTLSRKLLQQRAKPNIRRSRRSRSWLPTQRYRAIWISLSSSIRLYFLIWTLSASYACRFLCSQKETKLLQLLTHFPSFYLLAIPDQLCILLHTESFLHQTLHQITQLLPSS
jgi:hypothetical protein